MEPQKFMDSTKDSPKPSQNGMIGYQVLGQVGDPGIWKKKVALVSNNRYKQGDYSPQLVDSTDTWQGPTS